MYQTEEQFLDAIAEIARRNIRLLLATDMDGSVTTEGGVVTPAIQLSMARVATSRKVIASVVTGRGPSKDARMSYFPPQDVIIGGTPIQLQRWLSLIASFAHVLLPAPSLTAILPTATRGFLVPWEDTNVFLSPLAAAYKERSDELHARLTRLLASRFLQKKVIGEAIHTEEMARIGHFENTYQANMFVKTAIEPLAQSFGFMPYSGPTDKFQEFLTPTTLTTPDPRLYKPEGLKMLLNLIPDIQEVFGFIDSPVSDVPMVQMLRQIGITNHFVGVGGGIGDQWISWRVSHPDEVAPLFTKIADIIVAHRGFVI